MWRKHWIVLWAILAIGVCGCGDSADSGTNAAAGGDGTPTDASGNPAMGSNGPAEAMVEFLDAFRAGDDEKTKLMLTKAARETVDALDLPFEPPASDTAEFEVGDVQYVEKNSARVACMLSDLDGNSQRQSQEVIWMLRRESDGWRIAGFAAEAYPGGPLKALDFEDRQQMAATKEALRGPDEAQPRSAEAQRPRQGEEPIRR